MQWSTRASTLATALDLHHSWYPQMANTPHHDLQRLDSEAERAVAELGIPPCPKILTGLLREFRADEPDLARVASMIGADLTLGAAVLKTANSSFYGLKTKATSVQRAVAVLGLHTTQHLVTGLLLRQSFPAGDSAAMERFWEVSTSFAEIAGFVAREVGNDPHEAHTFALFRDAGMLIMRRKYPVYEDLLDGSALDGTVRIVEVEHERYGIDHTRVGFHLARTWELDEDFATAIGCHHDFASWANVSAGSRRLAAIGLVAERLWIAMEGDEPDLEWTEGGAGALSVLGVDESAIEGWTEAVGEQVAAG